MRNEDTRLNILLAEGRLMKDDKAVAQRLEVAKTQGTLQEERELEAEHTGIGIQLFSLNELGGY